MTSRGKNVKIQTLATEVRRRPLSFLRDSRANYFPKQNEIFVYDRRYVSEQDNVEPPKLPSPPAFQLNNPPDTLSDQNDLQAWRDLYLARKTWALKLAESCEALERHIFEYNERTEIVNRAAGVALENLKTARGQPRGSVSRSAGMGE
jgi:autophagy-related protein 11